MSGNNWLSLIALRARNYKKSIVNVGYYFLASFIPMVINLFLSPIFSIYLSPKDFAIIGYYASFQSIIWPLMLFELNQYYLREYFFRSDEEKVVLRTTIFKTFLILPILVMGLSLICIYVYLKFINIDSEMPFFPYALLTLLPWCLAGIYRLELIDFKVRREAARYFKVSILYSAILIITSVLLVVGFKLGATGKLLGAVVASIVFFIWSLSRHPGVFRTPIDKVLLKSAMLFSAPLVLAAMLDFFSSGFSKVYLEKYVTIEQLGIFTIGLSIAGYLQVFSSAIGETFSPDIYESIASKNNKRAVTFILIQLGIMTMIVLAFIVLARYAIILLTANRYVSSTPYARITSLSAISSLLYSSVLPFLFAAKKTKVILWTKIIGGGLSIVTFIVLIKYYGLYGASWGTVICPLFYTIIAVCLFMLTTHINIKSK